MSETNTVTVGSRRFSFDTAALWTLIGSVSFAALVLIPSGTIPFLYTKVSVLALGGLVALAFFILARLTRGSLIVPPLGLLGALWLVPLAYGLSTLFSGVNLSTALFGSDLEPDTFGFVLLLAAFGTLTALVLRRTLHFRKFFASLGFVLGAVLVFQVLFVLLGRVAPNVISSATTLPGTLSDLGMLAGLGAVISLLAVRFLELSGRSRTLLFVLIGLSLFALALANAPLMWGFVALGALGLFIEAIMHRRAPADEADLDGVETLGPDTDEPVMGDEQRSLATPLIVLIVSLFFLIGGSTIGNALVTALGTNVIDVRPSWQSTFDIGSHVYASSPLFGSGPGTFSEKWLQFRDQSLNETIFWNVDFTSGIGYIPTSFVTTGVLGVLAWLSFIGLFLFIGLRALLTRRSDDKLLRFVSIASFTGALYVLALSVFSVPGPIVLAVGFLLLGVFISSLRYDSRGRHEWGVIFAKNPRIGFMVVFGFTLLLLASVLAAYVIIERYLGTMAYAEAAQALTEGDIEGAESAVNRALLFVPTDRAYQLASAIGVARMNQIAADESLSASDAQTQFQAALSSSIEAALTATRLQPNRYQNWAVLGSVYQTVVPLRIEGAYENAKTAYERAMALNPSNPTLPFALAQLEIAQGNNAAAEEYLNQAIGLKNDYTEAIYLLSQLQVAAGRAREALEAAEAAAYFAPNDPAVLFQVGILRSGTGDNQGAIAALMRAVDLNPQYANARFFLAVAYAQLGQYQDALAQLEAVAALSEENAQAVAADMNLLRANRNPFPPSRLGALGIPQPGVTDQAQPQTAR